MRFFLAMALCVLYVTFGSVAGLAHVHGAAGHHDESGGLHLDHAHVEHPSEHHDHHHRQVVPRPAGDRGSVPSTDGRHADHHTGDALSLSQSAVRPLPNVRTVPAIVTVAKAIECPVLVSMNDRPRPGRPRDPPGKIPRRLRAPPA